MGSPVWTLAGVGQDSAGKVARGSSLESSGRDLCQLFSGLIIDVGSPNAFPGHVVLVYIRKQSEQVNK